MKNIEILEELNVKLEKILTSNHKLSALISVNCNFLEEYLRISKRVVREHKKDNEFE